MPLPYKVRGMDPFDQLQEQIRRNLGILPTPDFRAETIQDENDQNDPEWQGPRQPSAFQKAFPVTQYDNRADDKMFEPPSPEWAANQASKLPRSLQEPGGRVLSVLGQGLEYASRPENAAAMGAGFMHGGIAPEYAPSNVKQAGYGATEEAAAANRRGMPDRMLGEPTNPELNDANNMRGAFSGERTNNNFMEGSGGLADIAAGRTSPHPSPNVAPVVALNRPQAPTKPDFSANNYAVVDQFAKVHGLTFGEAIDLMNKGHKVEDFNPNTDEAFRAHQAISVPPEFAPTDYNPPDVKPVFPETEQTQYDLARDKFNMGRDLPEVTQANFGVKKATPRADINSMADAREIAADFGEDITPFKSAKTFHDYMAQKYGPEYTKALDGTLPANMTPKVLPFGKKAPESNEPQFARSDKGGIKIGQNIKRSAAEVTTGYSRPLSSIMVREGLQNAIDAVRHLDNKGKIHISVADGAIHISDNGKGMNRKQLETVFSDLYESGKTGEGNATGGKGIGKATYILGGKHFSFETVYQDSKGRKVKLVGSGTPDEFAEHVPIDEGYVSDDTPTGTKITTQLKADQSGYHGRDMLDSIVKHTRNVGATINIDKYGDYLGEPEKYSKYKPASFQPGNDDKQIGKATFDNSDVAIKQPTDTKTGNHSYINVHYLNNGMYQFSNYHYLDKETPHMPENLLVDIHPHAEEGTPDYPFPTQRESIKDGIAANIKDLINRVLVHPMQKQRQNKLTELYNSMVPISTNDSVRNTVMFDPGERLTPEESKAFRQSPALAKVTEEIDRILHDILDATGKGSWQDKLENVGLVLDPGMYGVHIPNPNAKNKSTILINPFQHMLDSKNSQDAAFNSIVTMLHEVAHIGNEDNLSHGEIPVEDIEDPRVGKFLASYIKQVKTHGGEDPGHEFGFVKRLGDIYAKFGAKKSFDAMDRFHEQLAEVSGKYNTEIQKLLHIYQDSRGRPEVTEDFLSGTGNKSKSAKEGEGSLSSDNKADGIRTVGKGKSSTRLPQVDKLK